jgi:hypothetical protein
VIDSRQPAASENSAAARRSRCLATPSAPAIISPECADERAAAAPNANWVAPTSAGRSATCGKGVASAVAFGIGRLATRRRAREDRDRPASAGLTTSSKGLPLLRRDTEPEQRRNPTRQQHAVDRLTAMVTAFAAKTAKPWGETVDVLEDERRRRCRRTSPRHGQASAVDDEARSRLTSERRPDLTQARRRGDRVGRLVRADGGGPNTTEVSAANATTALASR